MINRKYAESKLYVSSKILIIVSVTLVTFWPITVFMYGIPVFIYLIGVILLWTNHEKVKNKILWTIVPITLGLVCFNYLLR